MIDLILAFFSFLLFGYGIYVLSKDRKNIKNILFFLFCFILGFDNIIHIFLLNASTLDYANLISLINVLGDKLGFSFICHLCLKLTIKIKKKYIHIFLLIFVYLPGTLFMICSFIFPKLFFSDPTLTLLGWRRNYSLNIIYFSLLLWEGILICLSLSLCLIKSLKFSDNLKKAKVKLMFLGIFFSTIIKLIYNLIIGDIYNIKLPIIISFSYIPIFLFTGITIKKYNLFKLSLGIAADTIIKYLTDAVIVVDHEGKIVGINQSALTILGYSKKNIIKSFTEVLDFDDMEEYAFSLITDYENISVITDIEGAFKTIEGKRVPVSLSASRIEDRFQNLLGIVYIGRDITDKRRVDNEVNELRRDLILRNKDLKESYKKLTLMNEELVKISQIKDQFMSMVSHEFRTPLNSIKGFVDFMVLEEVWHLNEKHESSLNEIKKLCNQLYDKNLKEEDINKIKNIIEICENILKNQITNLNQMQLDCIYNIQDSSRHLLHLINDVLDISRIESSKLHIEPKKIILNTFIPQILGDIKTTYKDKDIKLIVKNTQFKTPLIADPIRLRQILSNLLDNAYKYTEKGFIKLKIIEEDHLWKFIITDTGIGIEKKNFPHLFQEFKRFTSRFTATTKGTGLGLAITKKLIILHGGEIWAESDGFNKGTTFTFTIPKINT